MLDVIVEMTRLAYIDFKAIEKDGYRAVLHRCSEGATLKDRKYKERSKLATEAGLLWGACHVVASTSSAKDQLQNIKSMVEKINGAYPLVALYIIKNKSGNLPKIADVVELVEGLKEYTGRYPLIKGSASDIDAVTTGYVNPEFFKNSALWIDYWTNDLAETPVVPRGWLDYVFWAHKQSDDTPIENSFKVSLFQGVSFLELKIIWNSIGG